VTFAHQAPPEGDATNRGDVTKRRIQDAGRTTLSLLKGASSSATSGTQQKIAALEAKLQQLEESKSSDVILHRPHPSLPPKPPFVPDTDAVATTRKAVHHSTIHSSAATTSLPQLPILPQKSKDLFPSTVIHDSHITDVSRLPANNPRKFGATSLKGVRIQAKGSNTSHQHQDTLRE